MTIGQVQDVYLQKVLLDKSTGNYSILKEYKVPNLKTITISLNSPVSPMPLPEEGADDNILIKIEGNSATMALAWTIKNEVTSPITFPAASTITEPIEQVNYFMNEPGDGAFQPSSIEDNYRVQIKEGSTVVYEKLGFFTKFAISSGGSSPVTWEINTTLIIGDVITSYEEKVPKKPTGLAQSGSNGSGEIKLIWNEPSITNGTLTGTIVAHRKEGKGFFTNVATATTDPNVSSEYTLSGLTSGAKYDIRVASKVTNHGDWSDILEGETAG